MGKSKRLPNDIVLAALQLVRGQARRKAEYKRQVDDIILRSGTNFVDTTTRCGTPVRVYLPCANGSASDITADKAEAIQQLETQRDVQIMRAIDAAADEIGADIQSPRYGPRCKRLLHSTARPAAPGHTSAWKCRELAG